MLLCPSDSKESKHLYLFVNSRTALAEADSCKQMFFVLELLDLIKQASDSKKHV